MGRSEIGWYDSVCHFCLSVEMKEKLKDLCIYHTFNIYNKRDSVLSTKKPPLICSFRFLYRQHLELRDLWDVNLLTFSS